MRFAVAFLFSFWVVSGAAPAAADDASRLKVARDIVEASHAAANTRALMPTFMQQMRPLMVQQGGNAKDIDAFMTTFRQRFDQQVPQFVDLAAQVYAREFSQEDLDALLAFYRSPAGQRLLDKQVVITQGITAVGMQWGQAMAKQVLDDFAKQKAGSPPKL